MSGEDEKQGSNKEPNISLEGHGKKFKHYLAKMRSHQGVPSRRVPAYSETSLLQPCWGRDGGKRARAFKNRWTVIC